MKYIGTMGSAVKRERTKAADTETAHVKQLSNRKVISVFPPERSVKNAQFAKPNSGMHTAATRISSVASRRMLSSVLYMRGMYGAHSDSSVPIIRQLARLSVSICHAVRRAFVSLSAPSSYPTTIPVALPRERKASLNICETVLHMFIAAMT